MSPQPKAKRESTSPVFSQTLLPMAKRCPGECTQLKMQTGQNATVSAGRIARNIACSARAPQQPAAERSDGQEGKILSTVSRVANEHCHAGAFWQPQRGSRELVPLRRPLC